jgi:Tol biopolymer transport system component
MRRLLCVIAVGCALVATAPAAHAADPLAPAGAQDHWIPDEGWVNLRWLPFDEDRLYALLHTTRGEVFRWVRVDATNTLAEFAARRGWKRERLVRALVAPRRGRVSAHVLHVLSDHTRRTLTQGHLGQHILFHDLHQTTIADHATRIFGVRSQREFLLLRRSELSPLQIGELHERTRVAMQRGIDRVLRAAQALGVRYGQTSRHQADAQLARQLRQVPRWLGQSRYNGPTGGKNQPDLPRGDLAKHPSISADGSTVVWDAYRTTIRLAELLGEIHVAGQHRAGRAARFGVSPRSDPAKRKPHSAYNSVLAADGGAVAFETAESTYPLAKRVGQMSVLLRDLRSGRVEKISHLDRQGQPTRTAFNPTISADARLVGYEAADNATATAPARNGLYVFDRASHSERLITEHGARGAAFLPRLSGDGTRIAATEADEPDGRTLVYLHPTAGAGGERLLVSRAAGAAGAAASSDAYEPAVARDGSVVAFTSRATNLGARGNRSRVWVRDLRAGTTTLASGAAPGDASQSAVSADGRWVAFVARLKFHSATIKGLRSRIYLFDRQTGRTVLISRRDGRGGAAADGYASEPAVSADGRRVVFASSAGNLTARKPRGLTGVFVRDVAAGTTRLLSAVRADGSGLAGRGGADAGGEGHGGHAAVAARVRDALVCPLAGLH